MPKNKSFYFNLQFKSFVFLSLVLSMLNAECEASEIIDEKIEKQYLEKENFKFGDSYRYTMTGEMPNYNTELRYPEALIAGSSMAVLIGSQHYYQTQTIYKEMGDFRFIEDGAYALYVDKGGHVFSAYFASYLFSESFITAGVSAKYAGLFGGIMGFSYEAYIEIMDGYGENWGFAWSDFYANTAGSLFFIAQNYIDELQYFIPKYNYISAPLYGQDKRIPSDIFIDDYASQTYWLSIDVHGLMPKDLKGYWPKWLNLSVGYAARNLNHVYDEKYRPFEGKEWEALKIGKVSWDNGFNYGEPKFIIALDYNLVELIPKTDYPFVNWVVQTLNYYKLPAPAIEFGRETKFMLMYPFIEF